MTENLKFVLKISISCISMDSLACLSSFGFMVTDLRGVKIGEVWLSIEIGGVSCSQKGFFIS